jgi:hypothetical protein
MKGETTMNRISYYSVCILSVVVLASCASMPVAPIKDRSVQKVHDIELTKNEIYDLSLEWMYQTFLDQKDVIELKDNEKGMLIGKGITSFEGKIGIITVTIPCRFTLIVETKDSKYRTTYNNFIGLWGENYGRPEPLEQKAYVDAVKAKLVRIDDDLHSYLETSKANSNW